MLNNLLLTATATVASAAENLTTANADGASVGEVVSGVTSEAAKTGGLFNSVWGIIILYGLFFGVLYLLIIRPNSKKRKQEEELRRNIEVGDEIITIGGIMGRVVSIKDDTDTVIIETGSDRVKMRIKRWSIQSNETVREKVEAEAAANRAQKKGLLDKLNEKLESRQNNKK